MSFIDEAKDAVEKFKIAIMKKLKCKRMGINEYTGSNNGEKKKMRIRRNRISLNFGYGFQYFRPYIK